MAEKDQKSLTIGDILDQLIKPPIVQAPEVSRPNIPSPISQPSLKTGTSSSEIRLPQLGKEDRTNTGVSLPTSPQPSELKLSIRTMSTDLAKIKQGEKPTGFEVKKALTRGEPVPKAPLAPVPKPVQTRPPYPQVPLPTKPFTPQSPPPPGLMRPPVPQQRIVVPPQQSQSLPPSLSQKEPEHRHTETIISKDELIPAFPGAPVPKKIKKPTEEKIEYGVLARIISSGMTTGIVSTIVVAVIIYFLLSYFIFNREDPLTPTPTPTPTNITPAPEANELETIFKGIPAANFSIPQDPKDIITQFKSFVSNQILAKKEFRKINFIISSQTNKILNFTELLTTLSVAYPAELTDSIKSSNMTFLYGQEEPPQTEVPRRIVLIVEVKEINKTREIMTRWESSMQNDLKNILEIDPTKASSSTFLDNDHRGVKIRYKNFPSYDKSIDYAIVTSLTGRNYLIITNSRESMYSPADKIRGLSN